jgi:uncharacterized protein (TIGR02145 family)
MKDQLRYNLMTIVVLLNITIGLVSCKKCETAPGATTNPAFFITQSEATLNGTVFTYGNNTSVFFEFGTTTAYGQIIKGPASASFSGSLAPSFVKGILKGLSANTTYHYRLKAVGSCHTTNGNDVSFTTLQPGVSGILFNPDLNYGSVSDYDGNLYKTIQIGTQIWMAENLKTTRFNDGTAIQLVTGNETWRNLTAPAYCWNQNDSNAYKKTIGALYKWYAVSAGKLCPTGWHVPGDAEWTALINYLGGNSVSGSKLKEAGTIHWINPNTEATNESGFTALPGGSRDANSAFQGPGIYGNWWSSTDRDTWIAGYLYIYSWYQPLVNSHTVYLSDGHKPYGFSVRCLKD